MKLEDTKDQKKRSLLNTLITEILEFKGWDYIFQLAVSAFVIWGIYVLRIVYLFHTAPQFSTISKTNLADFTEALLYVPIFHLLKRMTDWACFDRLKLMIDPIKFPIDEDRSERAKKATKWVFCITYYSCSTVACYFLFKDMIFFPSMLGGSGSCAGLFKYMPESPFIPNGQKFYMIQYACHLHALFDHIAYKRGDPKFWEMVLHHSVSVFLIGYSYMTNGLAIGILVLFVHDPSDVFLDLGRFYNDLTLRKPFGIIFLFLTLISVWFFTRLYVFPSCIIFEAIDALNAKAEMLGAMWHVYLYLIVLLISLLVLHIYWFIMLLKVALNIAMKKKDVNAYDVKKKEK
jgi:TLC domain